MFFPWANGKPLGGEMTQEVGLTRRLAGMLKVRLPELELAKVKDPRSARGKRWALESLLKATLVGMVAGCKSLAETEALTAELSVGMRRLLGLPRRVPDTTLRDLLED